jgi:2-polyprenyl-3-methyl-5-hydroxy-6-metoxy-1,4-benzoquinol methylase
MARTAEDFVERVFSSVLATYDVFSIYVGERLGLYAALKQGPLTPKELAQATDTDERYVREWLEQQAVTGFLNADDSPDATDRRFEIPLGLQEVLLDGDSLNYLAAFVRFTAGSLSIMPQLLDAFRTGDGVPYRAFGEDAREGQADTNRTQFINLLGSDWIPAIPDVHERLSNDPPAKVADVASGAGWSTIALARAYPKVLVDGFDLDEASIELANRNKSREGLDDRISFYVQDASDPKFKDRYDLVTVFEAIHDMARPVEALRAIREMLAPGGAVVIADERTTESFAAPGDDLERLFYAWSVFFCLPTGREDQPSAATGTVMRPDRLETYAKQAGFEKVEILPIANDFWRFYRLTPS